ncbi:MAG: PmoA family protein [Bacteroidales bacterium]
MKRLLFPVVTALVFSLSLSAQRNELMKLTVESGRFSRINTPVSVDLSGIVVNDSVSLEIVEIVKGKEIEVPCQLENGKTQRVWWILTGTTPAGTKRNYVLYQTWNKKYSSAITVENTGDLLRLKKSSKPVLDYNMKMIYPPAGVDTMYKRNGFIHPMFSPSGNILTRISPKDHYHHVGIWNPWTKVKIRDHVTDFWNLYSHQGTVRFAGVNSTTNGPVFGGFDVRQEHIDYQGKKPWELTLNEIWDVRVWNADPLDGKGAWIVDFTSLLSVAGSENIILEAYRYGGGLGFRATGEWDKNNSWVVTSEGKTRINADGTKARWTDVGGMFQGKGESGIVFMSHPSNRDYPEPMRVWPIDQNGRGDVYFEFCPIRYREWILEPGRSYSQRYRMLVYDGKVDKTESERVWSDFAYPPVVIISRSTKK